MWQFYFPGKADGSPLADFPGRIGEVKAEQLKRADGSAD